MRRNQNGIKLIFTCISMLAMIFDSKTAFIGASQGVNICIYTVVPSLLPFFVFSVYMTSELAGKRLRILQPIAAICGIPAGGEALLIMGLLGGYPIGAKCVANSYEQGKISRETAERLLGFCSNAGPPFIFGMMAALFSNLAAPWLLWMIHISTAIFTGYLLPGKQKLQISNTTNEQITFSKALLQSLKALANVCCWVILFRMLISFITTWFLWLFPLEIQVMISGILELVNGCQMLRFISSEAVRFILSSCFLSFGGICVFLQTVSVTGKLGTGMYLKGKLIQTYFSFVLSVLCSLILYRNATITSIPGIIILIIGGIISFFLLFFTFHKKTVAFAG